MDRSPIPCLSICVRCKPPGWTGDDSHRPGAQFARAIVEAVSQAASPPALDLREIHCMSQCNRPCVVAFSDAYRFTYLFGDLDPARDVAAVLDTFESYRSQPDGFLERNARAPALRAGILARVPPLGSPHSVVVRKLSFPSDPGDTP